MTAARVPALTAADSERPSTVTACARNLEFRRELVVDNDVGLRRRARPVEPPEVEKGGFRREEERRRDAAVGVQLLHGPPVRLRLDRDRQE